MSSGNLGSKLTDGDDMAEKRAGDMLDRNKILIRNRTTGKKHRQLQNKSQPENNHELAWNHFKLSFIDPQKGYDEVA